MIFVTVGSQTPFDRLIEAVDRWAVSCPQPYDVMAQIGDGTYVPQHVRWVRSLPPAEFRRHCQEAEVIVAHAGMGSVLTALEFAKPMVLMPRRAALRETRNDHQVATARWLAARPGVRIADDADQLAQSLTLLQSAPTGPSVSAAAPGGFIQALKTFIDQR